MAKHIPFEDCMKKCAQIVNIIKKRVCETNCAISG